MMFTRKELQEIKEKAEDSICENKYWHDAIGNLAMAADHLDAMMARTEVEERPIKKVLLVSSDRATSSKIATMDKPPIAGEGRPLEIGTEAGWNVITPEFDADGDRDPRP